MTDEEFLKAFEDCTLEEFHHKDHIRMAWMYLREFGYEVGSRKVKEGIQRFAAAKNATTLYHETITEFWIRLVLNVIESYPHIITFPAFFELFEPLRDSNSIYRHYSKEYLMGQSARSEFQAPDLFPMPAIHQGRWESRSLPR